MPLTINECSVCGHAADIDFHLLDGLAGVFELILFCPNCTDSRRAYGMTLDEVKDEWNDLNTPKQRVSANASVFGNCARCGEAFEKLSDDHEVCAFCDGYVWERHLKQGN